MSRGLAGALHRMALALTAPLRPARRQSTLAHLAERLAQRVEVPVPGGRTLSIECPSARALHDPLGFGVDEPETIAWIDGLPPGEAFWDIGANIGLYALYAAARGLDVTAFEPSAASFAALTRNIEVNGLDGSMRAYCLAFDAATAAAELHMAATEAGHSMHGLHGVTAHGQVRPAFRQAVLAFPVDGFRAAFGLPAPRHVKLDVDGLEPAILEGAAATLREVDSLLVEILDETPDGDVARIRAALAAAGLEEQAGPRGARNRVFRRPSP